MLSFGCVLASPAPTTAREPDGETAGRPVGRPVGRGRSVGQSICWLVARPEYRSAGLPIGRRPGTYFTRLLPIYDRRESNKMQAALYLLPRKANCEHDWRANCLSSRPSLAAVSAPRNAWPLDALKTTAGRFDKLYICIISTPHGLPQTASW